MTKAEATAVAMRIAQNEQKNICDLSDTQIEMYLVDNGIDDSIANVRKIRAAA